VRVLVLSSVFPSSVRPSYGVFVRERALRVAEHCAVEVVAPIPWFPLNRWIRGKARSQAPRRELDGPLQVHHPRFFSLPAIGKTLDAFFYFLSLLFRLRRLRRRFRFDVIDAHFAYPDGAAAVLLGRALACPVMVTMRGNEVAIERFALRRWQIRFALRHAHVVTVSAALRDLALRLGAPAERVRVIPNGVDPSAFHPRDRRAAREILGLPKDRSIVVSVGAFVAGKGHELILDLLPGLHRAVPSVMYVAVGNTGGGESRLRQIRKRIEREGLDDYVRLAVDRPHSEIGLWLSAADTFCLATSREGCSNAILEALAVGLPVVTTDIPGNRELIRDGENGSLVPYFDGAAFTAAIVRALRRDWDAAPIRTTARTWDEVGREAVDALRHAARRPQPPG
jgi:glycosyltransferase involved in cell wall biosynthesis